MLRTVRAVWRLGCVVVTLLSISTRMRLGFARLDRPAQEARVARWAGQMLAALGIELQVQGQPRPGAKLIVGNHVSWLDIAAIDATVPSRFVSKAEVAQWPIVGRMVTLAGTVYLHRASRRDAKRVLDDMTRLMQEGHTAAVFPEGTTGDGHRLLHFHANLLQSAIDADVPVQPVAIRYSDAHHAISPAPAYTGDTTLMQSLWAVALADRLRITVTVLPLLRVTHADRRSLASLLQAQIGQALGESGHHALPEGERAEPDLPVA